MNLMMKIKKSNYPQNVKPQPLKRSLYNLGVTSLIHFKLNLCFLYLILSTSFLISLISSSIPSSSDEESSELSSSSSDELKTKSLLYSSLYLSTDIKCLFL